MLLAPNGPECEAIISLNAPEMEAGGFKCWRGKPDNAETRRTRKGPMKDYPTVFSVFDTIAYMAVGFLFWVILAMGIETLPSSIPNLARITATPYVLIPTAMLMCYISGHFFALLGGRILEGILVAKVLGYPSEHFFSSLSDKPLHSKDWLLNYKTSFPCQLAEKIRESYENITSMKFDRSHVHKFCFHYVKEKSPSCYSRLLIFLQLYSFCRNGSTMFFCAAILFLVASAFGNQSLFVYSLILLPVSALLFERYLKFFKLFGEEVFLSFYVLSLKDLSELVPWKDC